MDGYAGNVQDPTTLHKYVYTPSNPVNYDDPTGMFWAEDDTEVEEPGSWSLIDSVRAYVSTMDWDTADAFSLAYMHQFSAVMQFGAIVDYVRHGVVQAMAASQYTFAMIDFLKDYVYVDPMTLPLGFIGARACFMAGTQVVVGIAEDGSYVTRNIEELRPGDMVVARDQYDATDDLDLRPVVQVYRKISDHLRIVSVRDASGNVEIIQTTDEHPFWVEGIGWLRAGDLRVGMQVDQPDGSNAMVISSVRQSHPEGIAVYNFEVEGDHTYFVEDGQGDQTPIWVHNACGYRDTYLNVYKRFAAAATRIGKELVQIHHRIPQTYVRMFGEAIMDSLSNLVGMHKTVHQKITGLWSTFRARVPAPTATEVVAFARRIDDAFGQFYHTVDTVADDVLETIARSVRDQL